MVLSDETWIRFPLLQYTRDLLQNIIMACGHFLFFSTPQQLVESHDAPVL